MKRNYYMVGLVFVTFFVISFITNILGALIPDIQHSFHLSYSMVAFLPFSFFIAYGIMSIPAGIFIEAYGEKKAMLVSFGVALAGAALLSLFVGYTVSLLSLFLMGIGMAMLQVVINPLLRSAGGEEHFAFNSVLAQLLFGLASFISPRIYTYIGANWQTGAATTNGGENGLPGGWFLSLLRKVTNPQYTWTALYWVFLLVIGAMILIVLFSRYPTVILKEEERSGTRTVYAGLLKNRTVLLYFLGIFCYVGVEQGVSDWMSEFLHRYHGKDPLTDGANAVSWYWGLMTLGCALNLLLLKLFDSRKLLLVFTALTMIILGIALWGPIRYAELAFPAIGFTISILFSVIFSLALNSLPSHHGSFSGILCTGIAGGAAVPLLIGWLADHAGLRTGMSFIFICLAYILSIGIWAKPLINNKTILSSPQ
jgi:FHS family L-fucose permease-like MFS transporter